MKKSILIVCMMLITASLQAQINFTLKGVAADNATKLIYGNIADRTAQPKTVDVAEGKFTITDSAQEGSLFVVVDRDNRMQSFFAVDAENITLDMNTDVMTGGALNEKLTEAMKAYINAEQTESFDDCLKIIEKNKDNCVGAFMLNQIQYSLGYEKLKELLSEDAPYLNHPLAAGAKQILKSLELRAPGSMFKDLEENDVDGKPHKLSEYVGKGNYVLVDFWASWCGPCMQEMPNVKANYEKYHPKGFEVVGLSFDRNEEAWKNCIKEHALNWIHLSDLKFWQSIAASTYGIQSIPSSILIDPDGKIVACDLRGQALGKKLAQIYGE